MKTMTIIDYPDMKVAMREDIYSLCRNAIKDFFEVSSCNLFNHTVIKNYRKEDHVISSFGSNVKWLELYWDKYRNIDPLDKQIHKNIFDTKLSLITLNILEPDNQCTEDRFRICNIKNGFSVAITHPDDVIENMAFGWQNFDTSTLNMEKVSHICQLLEPVRDFHLKNGLSVFSQEQ